MSPPLLTSIDGIGTSGLVLWLDSRVSFPGLTNNTAISSANDLSFRQDVLSAVSPSKPVFGTGYFAQSSKPAILYPVGDAGTDFLMCTPYVFQAGFSVFCTMKGDGSTVRSTVTTTGNCPMTLLGDRSAGFVYSFGITGASTVDANVQYNYAQTGPAGFSTFTGVGQRILDGNVHTIAVAHNAIDGSIQLYSDGLLVATGVQTWKPGLTRLDLVGAGNGSHDGLECDVAEVMVWDDAVDSKTIALLHARALQVWV